MIDPSHINFEIDNEDNNEDDLGENLGMEEDEEYKEGGEKEGK
jgi:hypothetical protein